MDQQWTLDLVQHEHGHAVLLQGYFGVCTHCGKLCMRRSFNEWLPTGWGVEQCQPDSRVRARGTASVQP